MATFQLFFQSGRAKDLSSSLYIYLFVCFWRDSPQLGHGFLIHHDSRSHITTHHNQYDSSGRVISSSQRLLPENTQHSQQTSPVGFEPAIPASKRQQTHGVNRATTGVGCRYSRNLVKLQAIQIMAFFHHNAISFHICQHVQMLSARD